MTTTSSDMRHGFDCQKVPHVGTGHLHGADDDRPYDVDGVEYCGRCHYAMCVPVRLPREMTVTERADMESAEAEDAFDHRREDARADTLTERIRRSAMDEESGAMLADSDCDGME